MRHGELVAHMVVQSLCGALAAVAAAATVALLLLITLRLLLLLQLYLLLLLWTRVTPVVAPYLRAIGTNHSCVSHYRQAQVDRLPIALNSRKSSIKITDLSQAFEAAGLSQDSPANVAVTAMAPIVDVALLLVVMV